MALAVDYGKFNLGKKLFLKEEFSDVEIFIDADGCVCRFPCHKVILSTASEVFAKMFSGATGRVTVQDISPHIMLIVLKYIYKGSIDLKNCKTAVVVLGTAHKYKITPLVQHCELYLSENLTLKNLFLILNASVRYDLVDLKLLCLALCKETKFLILKAETFKNLSVNAVKEIISLKYLFFGNEMILFKALWEWATVQCCMKQKKLTEENILSDFSVFSEYLTFDHMTDLELSSLSKSLSKYIANRCIKEDESNAAQAAAKLEQLQHPFNLDDYCTTANLSHKTSVSINRESYMSLLRFSLKRDTFLLNFTVAQGCLCQYKNNIKMVRFSCNSKIVLQWFDSVKSSTLDMKKCNTYQVSRTDCTDSIAITKVRFDTITPILLEADVQYIIDIETNGFRYFCPRVYPKPNINEDEVEVIFHSECCYGVTEMKFLPTF